MANAEETNVRPRIQSYSRCPMPPPGIMLGSRHNVGEQLVRQTGQSSRAQSPFDLGMMNGQQQPYDASTFNQNLGFETNFPREYLPQPPKLLGAIRMENNQQQDMRWVAGAPPVDESGLHHMECSDGPTNMLPPTKNTHLKAASDKANAEQTPAHPDIMYYDGNLPSPWWELKNEIAGICYYWNSVSNVTQSERPSCCPPIQPCPTCGSNSQLGIVQTQLHQELQAIPMTNNQQHKRVVVSPNRNVEPRFATGPNTGLGSKESLYLSFLGEDGRKKWYYLNVGGNINENGSRHELITNLLDEASRNRYGRGAFTVLNSSIYMIFDESTGRCLPSFMLQVLETQSQEMPAWKNLTPLAKNRVQLWAVSMGGKIYAVGAENKGTNIRPDYELNEIVVIKDLELCKWEELPIRSLKFNEWEQYFVVAFEDENKLVIGSGWEKCLYLYDVCTHDVEKLDFVNFIGRMPPVFVGNKLFKFFFSTITAYDLVERCFWEGKIDGLDKSFFWANCNEGERPELIHLGGNKLCLVCVKSRSRKYETSVVHCCTFYIPEFRKQGGKRSLHGHFLSVHKFYVEHTSELLDVLLM